MNNQLLLMVKSYSQLNNKKLKAYINARKKLEKNKIENFIEDNEELIYERYCEVYPEKITSDFSLEEVSEELEDFVKDYMSKELEGYYGQ